MSLLKGVALLLATLPVTFASPTAVTLQSREAKPMEWNNWGGGGYDPYQPYRSYYSESGSSSIPRPPRVQETTSEVEAARTGNDNDRMSAGNFREAVGIIAIDSTGWYVCLIRNTGRNDKGWIFPKGGWEKDESKEEAWRREAKEEGGLDSQDPFNDDPIEVIETTGSKHNTRTHYHEMTNAYWLPNWPESKFEREWFLYADAKEALKWRSDLVALLDASSIVKHQG